MTFQPFSYGGQIRFTNCAPKKGNFLQNHSNYDIIKCNLHERSYSGAPWLQEEARLGKVEDNMDALGQEKSSQLLDLGKMEQDLEVSAGSS